MTYSANCPVFEKKEAKMRRHFELELKEIQQELLRMGGMAESMLHDAVDSVLNRDGELAADVIRRDEQVDILENEIEESCIRLIARHQPAASDVRLLSMVLTIIHDVERMADKAVNIAQRSLELIEHPPVKPFVDLPRIAGIVQEMAKDALDALVNRDADLAEAVREGDYQVDEIYNQTAQELLARLSEDTALLRPGISILLLFRHLERIGDLAANISEEVYYLVKGDVLRHT
jgi:phosphate transport system protein